jgi:DASH complex subunit ASK1
MQSQFESVSSAASNKMRTPAFGYGGGTAKDDTMSTIPSPPSLSRYTRHAYPSWTDSNDTDASLATMMRRVGLEMPESSFKADSVGSASHSRASSQTDVGSGMLARQDEFHTLDHQELDLFEDDQSVLQLAHATSDDSDSDSDSLNDEPIHSSQPSTAFLMASSREPDPDDSFGSSNHSSDSLGADEFGDGEEAAVHPFARALEAAGDGFDDSFDSEGGYEAGQGEDASETVFGIPPAQRRQQGREPGELRLLGGDLLQDTIGIGGQLAKVGRVEESPTPYGRGWVY